MKKRLLSLLLALVMTVSLFSGLSLDASADDLIADWIQNEAVIGTVVGELYNKENIVYHGYCGDASEDANHDWMVQFDIYEITNPYELNDNYLKPFFDQILSDPDYTFDSGVQYYGVWIYGNGAMKDYNHLSDPSPWSGTLTLNTGETVDLEEKLIVAYIEGAGAEHPTTTGVTTVGTDAFWGQDYLTAVFLGNTVQKIKESAFESTELLAAINMPNALDEIQRRAFYGCDKLTFLRASATKITTIGERAFFGNSLLADVELPYTLKTIEPYAFAWCRILGTKNIVLPNGLTTIGEGAFAFCTHFSRLTVPNSVTSIGPYAFLGAYELSELSFTDGDTPLSIGAGAFAANYNLTEVNFPDRLYSIGVSAFGACEKLQRVSFGTDLITIGERAFTSMVSDAYTGLAVVAEIRAIGDPSGELDTVLQELTKITPLEDAAFSGDPCYVTAADDVARTFPDDCIVHYPEGSYQWLAVVTKDGKWQGYQTGYYWTGHFHELEETAVAATCTEPSYTRHSCTVSGCDYYYDDNFGEPLGHDGTLLHTLEPTCTRDGANYYVCQRPGCTDSKYFEIIPALGHDESNCIVVEATCTEPGSVKGVCARCGAVIDRVIPAKGHNTEFFKVETPPTCTTDGAYEEGPCPDCGEVVKVTIPALGHDESNCTVVEATCTEPGSVKGVCARCGAVIDRTTDALGHNYIETDRLDATTTTAGYVTYTCTRCGDAYTETLPATACTGGPDCPGYGFTDMPKPGDWSHEGLDYCLENGIINGVGNGMVNPGGTTTRAQLVTMLYRMQGEPSEYSKYRSPFTDTPRDQYYFNAVLWAYYNGIVDGVGNNCFAPNSPITREQLATIFLRYTNVYGSGATGSASLSQFPDAGKVSSWSLQAMQWAVANGIISGVAENGTNYLRPQGDAKRNQVATIIMRYERNIVQK